MTYYVYILISAKRRNWSYVGSTSDIKQRFKDHNYGKVKSTKGYRPLKLIKIERFSTKEEAYNRELFYKSGIGRAKKQKIINQHYSGIV